MLLNVVDILRLSNDLFFLNYFFLTGFIIWHELNWSFVIFLLMFYIFVWMCIALMVFNVPSPS